MTNDEIKAERDRLATILAPGGMFCFLQRAHVGLLDFKDYVEATTKRVIAAALHEATAHARPIRYLESSKTDKEKLARQLLAAGVDGITTNRPEWLREQLR